MQSNLSIATIAIDRRTIFSTLWIFVTLNYLYCDVLSLMSAEMLSALLTGNVGGIEMTESTLLWVSMLMEISIAMVLLSRVLNYRATRWANIVAGSVKTMVMIGTLFMGASYHYIFFAIIEISATSFIVWYAWNWTDPHNKVIVT